jgi:hypothetical protein
MFYQIKLSRDIISIITKYTSKKIYIVNKKLKENSQNRGTDLFGAYSTYDRAYASIFIDINRNYKKYKTHQFKEIQSNELEFYEDVYWLNNKYVKYNYLGNVKYWNIYTTINEKRQFIYEIQEHFLNVSSPDGVGLDPSCHI